MDVIKLGLLKWQGGSSYDVNCMADDNKSMGMHGSWMFVLTSKDMLLAANDIKTLSLHAMPRVLSRSFDVNLL